VSNIPKNLEELEDIENELENFKKNNKYSINV
jgi:hypothetical protein